MMKRVFLLLVMGAMLSACCSTQKAVGNDADDHGCLPSAGYSWSVLNSDCIRLFESASCIGAIKEGGSLLNVYVVFSADNSKAELFMPGSDVNPILELDQDQWKGSGYVLSRNGDKYLLSKDGNEVLLK